MTLVELLVVVAMVGVLAALAITGTKRWLESSKAKEDADASMHAVASAIDAYYKAHNGYLACNTDFTPANMYPFDPKSGPVGAKWHFRNSGSAAHACWKLYNVAITATSLGFAVQAGTAADAPPAAPFAAPAWPTPSIPGPWFVLVGATDLNKNGVYGYYVMSSFAPGVIWRDREGE